MLPRDRVRRVLRSGLVLAPGVYEWVFQRRILWTDRLGKVHDRDLLALPGLLPHPRALVLDIGANCGQTVLSVKRMLPDARIISFEPNPVSVVVLRRLCQRFPDLRIEPVGLGNQHAEAEIYVPVYNGKAMTGLASFDYDSAKTWLNQDTLLGFRPERLEVRTERAAIRRLDDYGLDPDLIKIDAQGFEDQVVGGGMGTIERARPVLLIENASAELVSVLLSLDYLAYEYRASELVPSTATMTNQYFLPS